MQTNTFGVLVKNAKGMVFSDGEYLYFPDRKSNLHEGIITDIEVVKDFRDTRGYAFITAKNVETEDFSEEELFAFIDTYRDVKMCNLGGSQILALERHTTSDYQRNISSFDTSYNFTSFVCKIDGKAIEIISGIVDKDKYREPFASLRHKIKVLDDTVLEAFCKAKFVGSADFNLFAQLKVCSELYLFSSKRNELYYCAEYDIIKTVEQLVYTNSVFCNFYAYDGEHIYRIDASESYMDKFTFEPLDMAELRKYALDSHICTIGYASNHNLISNKIIHHTVVLGSDLFIIYAYNLRSINFKDLNDEVLDKLINMTTENYLERLKCVMKRQRLTTVKNYTLSSWYFREEALC